MQDSSMGLRQKAKPADVWIITGSVCSRDCNLQTEGRGVLMVLLCLTLADSEWCTAAQPWGTDVSEALQVRSCDGSDSRLGLSISNRRRKLSEIKDTFRKMKLFPNNENGKGHKSNK